MIAMSAGPDIAESVRAFQAGERPSFPALPPSFDAAAWIANAAGAEQA
jgi:hypothetical protein